MPFILGVILGLISSTAAAVITTNGSYTNDLVQCLPQNNGLVSTTSVSFASNYSASPLIWTEAIRLNVSQNLDAREFYFGYSPSAGTARTSFRACSLFFYNPLLFPGTCVADLTAHFDQLAAKISLQTDEEIADFCHRQQHDLDDYHPDTCKGLNLRISDSQAFTVDASQPANCSFSTGQKYNLRMVTASLRSSSEQNVVGTTPVITILFPSGDGSNASNPEPEAHYAVLRVTKDLLPLVDGSGVLDNGSVYLVFLSWVVGVFFAVMEAFRM
ncbi:hypothetical protein BDW67DRAFT_183090 [Aspergillus spinulosporus]